MPTSPPAVAASDHHTKISVMALVGPPGASKSTAMRAFRRRFPGFLHFGVHVFFERQADQDTPRAVRPPWPRRPPVPGSRLHPLRPATRPPPRRRPENVRKRLARLRENEAELLAHYEPLGIVVRIDGTCPPAQVAAALEVAAPTSLL